MKHILLIYISILLFSGCQEVGDTTPLLGDKKGKQPIIIVNKNRHLNIADFWIDSIKDADKPFMSNSQKFIITTRAQNSLLIAGKYYDTIRMGVKLPYILSVDDNSMVLIPTKVMRKS